MTDDAGPLDPTVSGDDPLSWQIQTATCRLLYRHPSRGAGQAAALVPDAALGFPRISRDRRTYVFTVRRGLHFSDGRPIGPANYATAINRLLSPRLKEEYWRSYVADVVGAHDVIEGRAQRASGLEARGRRLIVRLTAPSGDLVERFAFLAPLCPVPLNLPPQAADILPGSGPYYVAARVPNRSITLRRNPRYRGPLPRRPATIQFVVGGTTSSIFRDADRGRLDVAWAGTPPELMSGALRRYVASAVKRYGINRGRLFRLAHAQTFYLALNSDRPLFRNNPQLRRAVNYALNRREILAQGPASFSAPTDQFLAPSIAGYRDAALYPLDRPDVARARQAARGHLRGGRAVLYVPSTPVGLRRAVVIRKNLAAIGLRIETRSMAFPVLAARITTRGEPFDIAYITWIADYLDPGAWLGLLHGRSIRKTGSGNLSYFDDPQVNRKLTDADRLTGAARYRAFGRLEHEIMREYAPVAPLFNVDSPLLVSGRLGCVMAVAYFLDLGSLCFNPKPSDR